MEVELDCLDPLEAQQVPEPMKPGLWRKEAGSLKRLLVGALPPPPPTPQPRGGLLSASSEEDSYLGNPHSPGRGRILL